MLRRPLGALLDDRPLQHLVWLELNAILAGQVMLSTIEIVPMGSFAAAKPAVDVRSWDADFKALSSLLGPGAAKPQSLM